MRDYQKYAIVLSVFASVLYVALIVAAFGVISLATDRDVSVAADAGPLLGPTMVGAAVLAIFVLTVRLGVTRRPERQRVAVGFAFLSGVVAFGAFNLVGDVLYAAGESRAVPVATFSFSTLMSPFGLATGILAFVVVLCYSLVLATHMREHGRPLWPWERRDDT